MFANEVPWEFLLSAKIEGNEKGIVGGTLTNSFTQSTNLPQNKSKRNDKLILFKTKV